MLKRDLTQKLVQLAKQFPVVALTGPRQSGKTTLAKATFPEKTYLSLEDLDVRQFALNDPRGFLNQFPEGAILDEIQRAPEIFSYLQTIVDTHKKNGLFILTGSHQFLMMQNLSQTLAGRVAIMDLLPFSLHELEEGHVSLDSAESWIFKGMYPRIYDQKIAP